MSTIPCSHTFLCYNSSRYAEDATVMPEIDNESLHILRSKSELTSPLLARQLAPGISVFFPAFNDAGTIASMVLAALHSCNRITDDYEVIVIENGSTDYTAEVVRDLMKSHE